jgi:hypothetical protein
VTSGELPKLVPEVPWRWDDKGYYLDVVTLYGDTLRYRATRSVFDAAEVKTIRADVSTLRRMAGDYHEVQTRDLNMLVDAGRVDQVVRAPHRLTYPVR